MEALVIGSGGREHAMAWALAKDESVTKIYVAPGNGGTSSEEKVVNLNITRWVELISFVKKKKISFTVVGPEQPLSEGVVDLFQQNGLKIFGPSKAASQLESSKEYAKRFMKKYNIPTGEFSVFTDASQAKQFVDNKQTPIVIKADGLAAGKGVFVALSKREAFDAIDTLLVEKKMGYAGQRIVIEEYISGEELSFIAAVDGKNILPLASSQDHKRLREGDLGPNTGGMGAISPAVGLINDKLKTLILEKIIEPTILGLKEEGILFSGFLYAGLMITNDGSPKVLEFNCRLGDPETQPILMRLRSSFADLICHSIDGTLDKYNIDWDSRVALGTVIASEGYPAKPVLGKAIGPLPQDTSDIHIFHAGTKMQKGSLFSNGGRIMCVTGLATSTREASLLVQQFISKIDVPNCYYRRDIGYKSF